VKGQVLDATGGIIVGALITVDGTDTGARASCADGSFELWLDPGPHQLRVHVDEYSEGWQQVWAPSSGVDIVLEPAASLIGVVRVEGTDMPAAQVTVSAIGTTVVGMPPASAISGAGGTFGISNLSAGDYLVRAEGGGWLSDWQYVTVHLGEQAGPIVCEVSRATSLRGRVSVAGVPCREGRVILSGAVTASDPVGADGAVNITGLKPGRYQADVRCPPGAPTMDTVAVTLEPARRDWDLKPGLSVRGSVSNENGDVVAGAEVLIASAAGGPEASNARCVTDGTGEFVCTGLLPGEHECRLAKSFPTPATVTSITLPAAEATRIRLVEPARGTIVAHQLGATARDLSTTSLLVRREGSPPVAGHRSASGIVFEDLPLATYDVSFVPSFQASARVALERPGQIVELELEGPERTSVSGQVLDERDQPVIDAWVRAGPALAASSGSPGLSVSALTDERGAFELAQLVSGGRYDISVSAPNGTARLPAVNATNGRELIVRLQPTQDHSDFLPR
jgi:hypothetical protein